jgi:hypothetical protein
MIIQYFFKILQNNNHFPALKRVKKISKIMKKQIMSCAFLILASVSFAQQYHDKIFWKEDFASGSLPEGW